MENEAGLEVEPRTSGSDLGDAQESTAGVSEQEDAWISGSCAWLSEDLDGLCAPKTLPQTGSQWYQRQGFWDAANESREQGHSLISCRH